MTKIMEFEGKTVEDAINAGLEALGVEREDINFEIVEREHKGIFGIGSKPAKVAIIIECADGEGTACEEKEKAVDSKKTAEKEISSDKLDECKKKATEFLTGVFSKMGVQAMYETRVDKAELLINIVSEDKGFVIGRRGETLDALQYLTSLAVNRGSNEHCKITLDIGNYREERVRTLESLARRLAAKAKKTRRNVSLEPMSAYERKIIHSALQDDKTVTTYSVGDEPNRKIVISCKPQKDQ